MHATAIVLAAGEGTRMKSNHAKVSHRILGKPMINWVVDAACAAGCERVVVVVGSHANEVRELVEGTEGVACVEQTERLGTGHAVKIALEQIGAVEGPVVVLNGDLPLIRPETIRMFAETVSGGAHAGAILTMDPPDCTGYGRVKFDKHGNVKRIIEQKDCTPKQAEELTQCNAGCYAFDGAALAAHIGELSTDNAQGEYYLTDMVEILRSAGEKVCAFPCGTYTEGLGVNSRSQLAEITALARDRVNAELMAAGVTMVDPSSVWVSPGVSVGRDTVILPQTMLMGSTSVGEECVIGPNTRLTDTTVGNFSTVDETVAVEAVVDNHVSCGPRAYLRPGTHMCDNS